MISVCMAFLLCEDLRFTIMPGLHLKTMDMTSVSLRIFAKFAVLRVSAIAKALQLPQEIEHEGGKSWLKDYSG